MTRRTRTSSHTPSIRSKWYSPSPSSRRTTWAYHVTARETSSALRAKRAARHHPQGGPAAPPLRYLFITDLFIYVFFFFYNQIRQDVGNSFFNHTSNPSLHYIFSLFQAVCCSDSKYCCPAGFTCDSRTASCSRINSNQLSWDTFFGDKRRDFVPRGL